MKKLNVTETCNLNNENNTPLINEDTLKRFGFSDYQVDSLLTRKRVICPSTVYKIISETEIEYRHNNREVEIITFLSEHEAESNFNGETKKITF